jgi:hypothetical protein
MSKKLKPVCITGINLLMLFKEIIFVYFQNTVYVNSAELLFFEAGFTYS